MVLGVWFIVQGSVSVHAVEIFPDVTPQPAFYRIDYQDRSNGPYSFLTTPQYWPPYYPVYGGNFSLASPLRFPHTYFGYAESAVDPVTLGQMAVASVQGVPSPYPLSYKTSNDPDKPIYAWNARQAYSFVVNGPPGNVLLTLSGKVSASGSGSYVSGAEVAFLDPYPPNPFLPPNFFPDLGIETPILSAWSAGGVGLGYGSQPIPDPSNLVHPFTIDIGSLSGAQ